MIYEVEKSINDRFNELNELTIQLSHTPWVSKIMYMQRQELDRDRVTFSDLNDSVQELRGYEAMNNFITTVAVVFPDKNLVISSAGMANTNVFFNELYRLPKVNKDDFQKMITSYGAPKVLMPQLLYSNQISERVLPYIHTVPSPDQRPHAVLVTYIKGEKLKALLQVTQVLDDSSIYIFNEKGEEIASLNGRNEILDDIRTKNHENMKANEKVIKVSKDKYFASTRVSNTNKWTYIMLTPQKTITKELNTIKYLAAFFTIILFSIGLAFSYIMASHNYNPLYKLVKLVIPYYTSSFSGVINEYDLLHEAVSTLLHEDELLRMQSSQQNLLLQNAYLVKVLEEDPDIMEYHEQMQKVLHINFIHANFIAVVFFLKNIKALKNSVHIRINKCMEAYDADIFFAEISGKKKAAVINFDCQEQLKQLIEELKIIIEEELETNCTASVGSVQPTLKEVSCSYREAMVAVNYRFTGGKREIVFFDEIKASNILYYYYPTDKEAQLVNALKMANFENVQLLLREIIDKNTGSCTGNIKCLFYNFLATALIVINDMGLNEFIRPDKTFVQPADTIEEIEQFFSGLYGDICSIINKNKKGKNELLKESIRVYMEENYDKQDMCLEKVSEAAGISPSYLSKFFKEEFGYNFLDYLNRKRIEKAKVLLNGNMTIIQIAQIVGYNNDVTFRRVFKKYEGSTPGSYVT
jgi:two-component system, response regulator YesN